MVSNLSRDMRSYYWIASLGASEPFISLHITDVSSFERFAHSRLCQARPISRPENVSVFCTGEQYVRRFERYQPVADMQTRGYKRLFWL